MHQYEPLLANFTQQSVNILGSNLVGIYLHGSAVMGCFHAKKSDIDLLIVVEKEIPDDTKRQYMDMAVALNQQGPPKGMEFSIVKAGACRPFVYPTPYELHFSIAHVSWYQSDPEGYIANMKGTDKDLAAHIAVAYHKGKTLYGKKLQEVFSEVPKSDYLDSIWNDIGRAKEEITENPTYLILNLCRALAYKKEDSILSKQEGGEWGLLNLPPKYACLISGALAEYQGNAPLKLNAPLAEEYAEYMLGQMKA